MRPVSRGKVIADAGMKQSASMKVMALRMQTYDHVYRTYEDTKIAC